MIDSKSACSLNRNTCTSAVFLLLVIGLTARYSWVAIIAAIIMRHPLIYNECNNWNVLVFYPELIQDVWLWSAFMSSSQTVWTSDFRGLKWICSLGIKKLANISMEIKINAIMAVIYASSLIADITSMKWLMPCSRSPQRRIFKKCFLIIIFDLLPIL